MLTSQERVRFNELRDRHDYGTALTDAEGAEVEEMTRRIEADEAAYLRPAGERVRQETVVLARRAEALRQLAEREEQFQARLDQTLRELEAEQENLSRERERLLTVAF